jgi:hypothetical protein
MLDRSEHHNLFDPGRSAVVEDEPRPDAGEATRQRSRRVPHRMGALRGPSFVRRVVLRGAGAWRLLRFASVAVLFALLLAHAAGCGRSAATTKVTRVVTATHSPTLRAIAAQMPVRKTYLPPRLSYLAPRLVAHARKRTPVPVGRPTVTTAPAPQAQPPVQVMPAVPVPVRVPAVPVPSHTTPPPAPASREAGEQFGFEH